MAAANAQVDYRQNHFEFPILTQIVGEPTYDLLRTVLNELKANAQSVHSTLGGGAHGYLGLILSPIQYGLVSAHAFVRPAFPAPLVIPPLATIHMTATLQQQHRDDVRIFRECQAVEAALRQQLVQAVDRVYLEVLRDPHTNAINRPLRGIIQHLMDGYGNVTAQQLADETDKVQTFTFDPVQPIDTIFAMIETLQLLAEHGKAPFTPFQIINFAYNIVNKTRKFKQEIKMWNRRPAIQKTWLNFKMQFRQAQKELRETDDLRLDEQFQHANLVQDIVSGLSEKLGHTDESAMTETVVPNYSPPSVAPPQFDHFGAYIPSPPSSCASIPPLQANAVATPDYLAILQQLAQMQTTIAQMVSQQDHQPYQRQPAWERGGRTGGRDGRDGRNGRAGRGQRRNISKYCWTHGACAHAGTDCRDQSDGHVATATFTNKQNGSTRDCT